MKRKYLFATFINESYDGAVIKEQLITTANELAGQTSTKQNTVEFEEQLLRDSVINHMVEVVPNAHCASTPLSDDFDPKVSELPEGTILNWVYNREDKANYFVYVPIDSKAVPSKAVKE